jgi:predicted phosphodiesterase
VASAAALTFGVVEREVGYLLVAATGFLYLALSKGDRAERYSASLVMRVRNAAEQIRPLVHADFVVFAHTHVAESRPGYVNTGSFGFPTRDGRPFLLIEEDGSIKRGYVESNLECRVESLVL